MSEWQPIETAPRDGTSVLCYWPPAVQGGLDAYDVVRWHEYYWCDDDTDSHFGDPAYWIPLPAPPTVNPRL